MVYDHLGLRLTEERKTSTWQSLFGEKKMRKKLSFQVLNEQAEDRYPPILIFGMVDVDTILISLEKWKWFFFG